MASLRKMKSPREEGAILLLTAVTIMVITAISGAFLGVSSMQHKSAVAFERGAKALTATESAVDVSIYELNTGQDYDNFGLGNV